MAAPFFYDTIVPAAPRFDDDTGGFFRLVLDEAAAPIAGFLDTFSPIGPASPVSPSDSEFLPIASPSVPSTPGIGYGSPGGAGGDLFSQAIARARAAQSQAQQNVQVAQGQAAGMNPRQSEFIQRLDPLVRAAAGGVDPSLILAIAAHETGWGSSNLARTQNNLFGVKDLNHPSGWAAYATPQEAIAGLVQLLQNQRYANALRVAGDVDAFPRALADAGYIQPLNEGGPDYAWAQRITNIARQIQASQQAPQQPQLPQGAQGGPQGAFPGAPDAVAARGGRVGAYTVQTGYGDRYGKPLRDQQGNVTVTHHRGVDLVRSDLPNQGRGSPVIPFVAGTVVYVGSDHNGGTGVAIRDAQGLLHYYFHLDSVLVKMGQQVPLGQQIGTLGSTGINLADPGEGGPHLHYEVRRGGQAIDPTPWLRGGGR